MRNVPAGRHLALPGIRAARRLLATLVLLSTACAPHAAAGPEGTVRPPIPQVDAVGIGEVRALPDIAVIRFAVETTGADAAVAGRDNALRMASLRQALETLGVPARDVSTTGYSIRRELRGSERPPPERVPTFVARNGIRVGVQALDRVGTLIDAALAGGANQVEEVAFRLSDEQPLRRKALALAVENARAQAQAMATAAGGRLGPLIEMSAGAGRSDGPQMFAARASTTPISAGEVIVVEQVAARWRFVPDGP